MTSAAFSTAGAAAEDVRPSHLTALQSVVMDARFANPLIFHIFPGFDAGGTGHA
jgi:hypothetical protein